MVQWLALTVHSEKVFGFLVGSSFSMLFHVSARVPSRNSSFPSKDLPSMSGLLVTIVVDVYECLRLFVCPVMKWSKVDSAFCSFLFCPFCILDASGQNMVAQKVVGCSLREGEELCYPGGARSRASAPPQRR